MGILIVLSGKDKYEEMVRYIEEELEDERVHVVIPDVNHILKYSKKGWIFKSGLTASELGDINVDKYDSIVLDTYDVQEMNHYLRDSKLMNNVLSKEGKKLYVLVKEEVNLKLKERIERVEDWKAEKSSTRESIKKDILKHKEL